MSEVIMAHKGVWGFTRKKTHYLPEKQDLHDQMAVTVWFIGYVAFEQNWHHYTVKIDWYNKNKA